MTYPFHTFFRVFRIHQNALFHKLFRRAEKIKLARFDGWLIVELAASMLTLAGIYIGSTTAAGASLYLASLVFWYALTFGKRLWGLMPLNVASTIVSVVNLWRTLA